MIYDSGPVAEAIQGPGGVAYRLNLAQRHRPLQHPESHIWDMWVLDPPADRWLDDSVRQHVLVIGRVTPQHDRTAVLEVGELCHHAEAYGVNEWPKRAPTIHTVLFRASVQAGPDGAVPRVAARTLADQVVTGQLPIDMPHTNPGAWYAHWARATVDAVQAATVSPHVKAARAHLN